MAIFDRLDGLVSKTGDRINAIPFVLKPMDSEPNSRPVPSVERDEVEGEGVFDYYELQHGIELGVRKSYREANDFRALQSGREPRISVDRRLFPTSADEPRQGDVLTLPTRPDLPDFVITSAQRDGLSRMVLKLAHLGRQA